VEKEELWDVNMNGKGAFERIQHPAKEYAVLQAATHYDAYGNAAPQSCKLAVNFIQKHLTTKSKL
jgi:hypothetical protein